MTDEIREINLEPNYEALRVQFSREATLQADNILDELPEEKRLGILRAFQAILNPLDVVTQCTTNLEQLVALRELIHSVSQAIVTKANEAERAITQGDDDEQDEDEQDDDTDPREEGDWVTEDHRNFAQHEYPHGWRDRVIVGEDEDWRTVLNARMNKDQFWPNVWFISDHGNLLLLDMNDGQHLDKE